MISWVGYTKNVCHIIQRLVDVEYTSSTSQAVHSRSRVTTLFQAEQLKNSKLLLMYLAVRLPATFAIQLPNEIK